MELASLVVRPGTLAELPVFAQFWLAMFEEIGILHEHDMARDWQERFDAYMRRRIEDGDARFFVAVDGEKIVATAGALVSDGYPFAVHGIKRGYIFGVRVDPAFRKRGLARDLTQACVAFLRECGCKKIRLHASPAGRPTYERLGFVPTNEMELR